MSLIIINVIEVNDFFVKKESYFASYAYELETKRIPIAI